MSADLVGLSNSISTVTLGGREFKFSKPSLKDIADAQQFSKNQKQEHRKEYIKNFTELLTSLPATLTIEEKKQVIITLLPSELTPSDKIKLFSEMPDSWTEEQKYKLLNRLALEREGMEWDESLYLVFKCLEKHQKITFDEVKNIITVNDLDSIVKMVSASRTKDNKIKNE